MFQYGSMLATPIRTFSHRHTVLAFGARENQRDESLQILENRFSLGSVVK